MLPHATSARSDVAPSILRMDRVAFSFVPLSSSDRRILRRLDVLDAAEPDVLRPRVERSPAAWGRPVALAVGGTAEEGAALDHVLDHARRIGEVAARRTDGIAADAARLQDGVRLRGVVVAAPVPDVAGHVEEAVAVQGEGADGGAGRVS